MLFINSVAKGDATLTKFFKTWWNKKLDSKAVEARTNKPDITMVLRDTLNNRVFEALGSSKNRVDFVLCENELNEYKARVWAKKAPMELVMYKKAVAASIDGGLPSTVYQTALRTVSFFF